MFKNKTSSLLNLLLITILTASLFNGCIDRQTSGKNSFDIASDLNNDGVIISKDGDEKKAIENFTKAIKLEPEYIDALYNRAFSYLVLGKFKKAMKDAKRIIEIEPKNPIGYHLKGMIHEDKGKNDLALECYDKAIELFPQFLQARYDRGKLCIDMGFYEKAVNDFNFVLYITPDNYEANYYRAVALDKFGKFDSAIIDYFIPLRYDSDYSDVLNDIAWKYVTSKDPKQREPDKGLTIALKLVDIYRSPDYLHTLAAAFAETGDFDKAYELEEEAISYRALEPEQDDFNYEALLEAYKQKKTYLEYIEYK